MSLDDSASPVARRSFEGFLSKMFVFMVVGALFSFLAFRVFQPYAFSGLGLNPKWLSNIQEQQADASPNAGLLWNLQWARRTHLIFFRKPDRLGSRPAARYPCLGRFPLDGLAHVQRRVAQAYRPLELDGHLFRLAIAPVQPEYALPVAHLPAAGDDGSLGGFRLGRPASLRFEEAQLAGDPGRDGGWDRTGVDLLPGHMPSAASISGRKRAWLHPSGFIKMFLVRSTCRFKPRLGQLTSSPCLFRLEVLSRPVFLIRRLSLRRQTGH